MPENIKEPKFNFDNTLPIAATYTHETTVIQVTSMAQTAYEIKSSALSLEDALKLRDPESEVSQDMLTDAVAKAATRVLVVGPDEIPDFVQKQSEENRVNVWVESALDGKRQDFVTGMINHQIFKSLVRNGMLRDFREDYDVDSDEQIIKMWACEGCQGGFEAHASYGYRASIIAHLAEALDQESLRSLPVNVMEKQDIQHNQRQYMVGAGTGFIAGLAFTGERMGWVPDGASATVAVGGLGALLFRQSRFLSGRAKRQLDTTVECGEAGAATANLMKEMLLESGDHHNL